MASTHDGVALAQELVEFIKACPSMFHAQDTISRQLKEAGFEYLPETAAWSQKAGGRYYTTRNNSSVIAWRVGEEAVKQSPCEPMLHFQLCASHSDSPTFKLKTEAELEGPQTYLRLDTEAYGGMIDYT